MKRQFTAIVKKTDQWYIAFCPEVPGANGQGICRALSAPDP